MEKSLMKSIPEISGQVGNTEIRPKLQLIKNLFSENAGLFVDAQPLLKKLPDILVRLHPRPTWYFFKRCRTAGYRRIYHGLCYL